MTKGEQGLILNKVTEYVHENKVVHTMTQNLGPMSLESLKKAHEKIESSSTIGKKFLEAFA